MSPSCAACVFKKAILGAGVVSSCSSNSPAWADRPTAARGWSFCRFFTCSSIIVFETDLYHLVPDPEGAFAHAYDLLKPGGFFISKTTCLGGSWFYWPLIKVMQAIGKAPYVGFFNISQLDDMVANAGFELVETGCYPNKSNRRFIVARKPA